MVAKKLIVDTKTGKETYKNFVGYTPPPPSPEGVSINFKKLTDILIDKGIINSKDELK